MKEDWNFTDIIEINPKISLQKGKKYPFIEMANVSTCSREPSLITEEEFSSGVKFEKNDSVLARIEPCLQNGKRFFCKYLEQGFGSTEYLVFRPKDKNQLDNQYLWYLLYSDNITKSMINSMSGATGRQRVNNDIFKSLKVNLPPLATQQKIASILSAYDDLIENNRKQIKLLEEASQKLYKEWFVKLNFPGHENTKITDGIPEGWKKVTVEDLLSDYFNGGWGKESLSGNCKNIGKVIRGTDINDIESGNISNLPCRYHSDKDIKNKVLKPGDIIFELSNGNINNIGRNLLVSEDLLISCECPVICASFCKLFRPQNLSYSLILKREMEDMQISKRMLPYKKNGANGINNFDFDSFLKHELLIPNEDSKIYCYFETYENQKVKLQHKLRLLQSARDKLLPKLMNGEIEV